MRLELIHPMIVHFPIALLSVGVMIRLVSLWGSKKPAWSFLLPASWLILGLGTLAAWAAVMAGELAREIVEPTLSNIALLNEHEEHAYLTASGFTAALLLDWVRGLCLVRWQKNNWWTKRGLAVVVWLLYFAGFANLIITGEYGAYLVYEMGAAVRKGHP